MIDSTLNKSFQKESLIEKPTFFYSFLPALFFGLRDSFNPYTLTITLLFIIYLRFIGTTQKRLTITGAFFLLSMGLVNFFCMTGFLDRVLAQQMILTTIRVFYFFIAVLLVWIAMINIQDWWQHKKDLQRNVNIVKFPSWLKEDNPAYQKKGHIFLSVFGGGLAAIFVSVWPQNYQFLVSAYSDGGKNIWGIVSIVLVYSFAFTLPLIGVWLGILYLRRSLEFQNQIRKHLSMLKMAFSAVFLSVGIGLLILVFYT